MAKAKGAAGILIEVGGGAITVHHSSSGVLLGLQKNAQEGDWNKLIRFLKRDLNIEWQVEDTE
jgi:hypothetical protein